MKTDIRHIWMLLLLAVVPLTANGQLNEKYNREHPLTIVCDWDKPPYEFLDDQGVPAGSNIDILTKILNDLGVHFQFVMKEWSNATKTFERGDADLILANVNRFKGKEFHITQIINYNRIRVAMTQQVKGMVSIKSMEQEGVVLKSGDYTSVYFRDGDTSAISRIEYQSPKVALTGLVVGDNKYFVWGEEPLKWKIKKLNLEGIYLNDVGIPVSEVHCVGRDKELIDQIDDQYSRLKQSGELELMTNKWFHPERVEESTPHYIIYIILGLLVLATLIYLFTRLAKKHVNSAVHSSTELNKMMDKALHMGNFKVMVYSIAEDRFTNSNGCTILPPGGLTLQEYVHRIDPDQQEEFERKLQQLLTGRERSIELNKRWNAGTDKNPVWLIFNGHALSELDHNGHPAYVVNVIHDVTREMEEDLAARSLIHKYDRLANMPFVGVSFYDSEGWLIDQNDCMKALCNIVEENSDSSRFWETMCMFDMPLFRDMIKPGMTEDIQACQHMYYPVLNIDKYIELQIQPLFNAEGQIANYMVVTLDNTAERTADHETHCQRREIAQATEQIGELKKKLDYILKNSHRTLTTDDSGKRYVVHDNSAIENARRLLKEERNRADQSVQLKSGFMASMTHELRTPLNAIVGFTGILEQLDDAKERQEYVRIIRNSSDMLERLINDIIEASSMADGPTSIKTEEVDFVAAFDDICMTLQQRIQNPEVRFIKENPYDHFYTEMDIERIQQVLTNFVTNAVKFTHQGHIRVGYRYEQHGLYLYCEDTGLGIPKEKQELIFGRFVKLDEFVQGTGMGLAISKSIAERCKGRIGVDSDGPGKGSTFWMWIPCERKLSV